MLTLPCFLSLQSRRSRDCVSLGPTALLHEAFGTAVQQRQTMDRLHRTHRSQKNIKVPPDLPRQDLQALTHTQIEHVKMHIKHGCVEASLIFVLQCRSHTRHQHNIWRKQSVQPSKLKEKTEDGFCCRGMDVELQLKILSPRGQCNLKNWNLSPAALKRK